MSALKFRKYEEKKTSSTNFAYEEKYASATHMLIIKSTYRMTAWRSGYAGGGLEKEYAHSSSKYDFK